MGASTGGIADGPGCFLLDVKFSVGQKMDQGRNDLSVYYRLPQTGHSGFLSGQNINSKAKAPSFSSCMLSLPHSPKTECQPLHKHAFAQTMSFFVSPVKTQLILQAQQHEQKQHPMRLELSCNYGQGCPVKCKPGYTTDDYKSPCLL